MSLLSGKTEWSKQSDESFQMDRFGGETKNATKFEDEQFKINPFHVGELWRGENRSYRVEFYDLICCV